MIPTPTPTLGRNKLGCFSDRLETKICFRITGIIAIIAIVMVVVISTTVLKSCFFSPENNYATKQLQIWNAWSRSILVQTSYLKNFKLLILLTVKHGC